MSTCRPSHSLDLRLLDSRSNVLRVARVRRRTRPVWPGFRPQETGSQNARLIRRDHREIEESTPRFASPRFSSLSLSSCSVVLALGWVGWRVCLILENSTVCFIVDELVCFASLMSAVWSALFGWVGWWVLMVSLTMILTMFLSVLFLSWMWLSFSRVCFFGGCGVCFSMESLILAQDERWRRA